MVESAEQLRPEKPQKTGLLALIGRHRSLAIVWGVCWAMALGAAIVEPSFRTSRNLTNVLVQASALGAVAAGQTIAIVQGGIDISVGALMSVLITVASYTMTQPGLPVLLTMLYFAAIAAAVGLLNGLGAAKLRLPPFILTLGMMTILQGLALQLRPMPGGLMTMSFIDSVSGSIGPVPVPALIWLATTLVVGLLMAHTIFGRDIYAVGGHEDGARLSGIPVARVRILGYMLTSLCAAVGAVILAGRVGSGDPLVGNPYGLDSITAVILGGSRLEGGRGGIAGTLAGVLILSMLTNILNLLSISTFYQYLVKGAVLIIAVILYSMERRSAQGTEGAQ